MELTLGQELRRSVAAHKDSKLQNVGRLYWAILEPQPKHPGANHNLCALAVPVNKAVTALPWFKTARNANSETEQFWLSYITTLIKEKQPGNMLSKSLNRQKSMVWLEKIKYSRGTTNP
jgi:hypothetical protein